MLRESEEKFRLLVAEVRDYAIFFLDLEGHVMTWNAGAERIKGYRADEIIGQSFVRFYVPEDVVAGVPSRLLRQATEQGVVTDEGLRVRKDGSRFWAYVVLTALHDKSGRPCGFAKITRDITEQKHAERRMAILADASRLLGESLDSDQILFTVTRMAVPNFADGVVIHVRDPAGRASSQPVPRHEPGTARCRSRSPGEGRLSSGRTQPSRDANRALRAPSRVDARVASRTGHGR